MADCIGNRRRPVAVSEKIFGFVADRVSDRRDPPEIRCIFALQKL